MQIFLRKVYAMARKDPKRIVLPEAYDERILRAVEIILEKKLAIVILLGNSQKIKAQAKKLKLKIPWEKVEIVDPENSKLSKNYAEGLYQLRKNKGLTLKQASQLIKTDINYFGTMMIQTGHADGMVTGATHPTTYSIRPVLQIIKTREKFHKVSGIFFMVLPASARRERAASAKDLAAPREQSSSANEWVSWDPRSEPKKNARAGSTSRLLLFADAAITVDPNSHDLVDIAIDTAETASHFGIKPKIALLSFSTKGSADHPLIDKIREAVAMIKDKRPDLEIDGELQVDAALVPQIAKRKCPDSVIQGDANVLIFPNLETANIAYKLVERLAKAKAIGPLLQGLKKPINKLSRGCSARDVVNVSALTVCECQH